MKALCFAPLHNAPGKRDGDEFRSEAMRFLKAHGLDSPVRLFDNQAPDFERREHAYAAIEAHPRGTLDTFALFSHGYKTGVQLGFGVEHARRLALTLKPAAAPGGLTVALYCCDTGRDADRDKIDDRTEGVGGDGGFADRLRDELCDAGVRATVWGHSTAGHTTWNPFVRVFVPEERRGGGWLVAPGSDLWGRWRRALDPTVDRNGRRVVDPTQTLRFRFPWLTRAELEAELRGAAVA